MFKIEDIGYICGYLSFGGITSRSGYHCDEITAAFILFQRLSTTILWCDMELSYGMFSSQLSEVFWEMVEILTNTFGHLLLLRGSLFRSRNTIYAESISSSGAPLNRCAGFIDCTKIRMARSGGHESNKSA